VDEKLTARAKLIYERDNSSPLFLRIAGSYLQSNNPENAISILENGLKNFPDHPLAFILLGKANVMSNDIGSAVDFFRKSSELLNTHRIYEHYKKEFNLPDKKVSPFDTSRGSVFMNSSEDEIPEIKDAVAGKLQPVEERLEEIAQELMNKRLDHNDNITLRESEQQQYSPDKSKLATETLANIYLSQGQKNEAVKIYELLIIRNPGNKEYYLNKIRNLKKQ